MNASLRWRKWMTGALCVGGLGYLVRLAYQMSIQMDWSKFRARPGMFVVIVGICVASMVVQFLCWWMFLKRKKTAIDASEGYTSFSAALLSRYLPAGKVLQFVGMHQFTTKSDERARTTYALMLVTLLSFMAGFIVSLPGIGLITHQLVLVGIVGAGLVAAGLLGLYQGWGFYLLGRLSPRYRDLGRELKVELPLLLLVLGAMIVFCWLADGMCCLLSLSMFGSAIPWNQFPFVLSAHFLSILGGAAAFILPTGIGIRDGLFVAFLKMHFSPPQAIWIALMMRFSGVIGEIAFLLPFLIFRIRGLRKPLRASTRQKEASLEQPSHPRKFGKRVKIR